MADETIGVLVMSYGTPESMEDVESYYTHIRRGHAPAPEQLNELKARYEAIVGGVFPLRENTNRQVAALEESLNRQNSSYRFKCYQGLKHARPYIEDGVAAMVKDGVTQAVGVVLAPHYSEMSVGGYIKRAQEKADEAGLRIRFVHSYPVHPKLIDALADRVEQSLKVFEGARRDEIRVIFTAHSLPEKIVEMNDPYPEQLLQTSRAVAEQTGVTNWRFGWQSAGRTREPWLGPDILEVLETAAKHENVQNVLICPVGFVSDHLEVLYDIDIECRKKANKLGIRLERTESLNTDPRYMDTLCDVITAVLERN